MARADQIIQLLIEDEEDEDFVDWKEITTDLPIALEDAGFVKTSEFRWSYSRNNWMTVEVTQGSDNFWYGRVDFKDERPPALITTLNSFNGSDIEVARWLEELGYWPAKHFADWNKFAAAARGQGIREGDEDDADWKELVPPEAGAVDIERWCFTELELKNPRLCKGTDEFLADGDAELGVIVLRNGTVTNRWEDGTVGVPPHCVQMADLDESPIKPSDRQAIGTEWEDHYADNWRDVYVDKEGTFLGFVDPKNRNESQEDDLADEDDWKEVVSPPNIATIKDHFDGDTLSYELHIDGKLRLRCWSTNEAVEWVKANNARWPNDTPPRLSHIPMSDDPLWPMFVQQNPNHPVVKRWKAEQE